MSDRKPKVFLMEPVKAHMNMSTADQFGESVYIFEPRDRRTSIFDVSNFLCEVIDVMKVKDFDPKIDYFCMAGGQITLMLAVFALQIVCQTHGVDHVKLLVFNSVCCGYEEITVPLNDAFFQFKAQRDSTKGDKHEA